MSKLFDKVIEVILAKPGPNNKLAAIHIQPDSFGPKPEINFKVSVVPGHAIYQVELRITNMAYAADIREYTVMYVTVGYRDPTIISPVGGMHTRVFKCHIYSAWQESPLPNSTTVFYGAADGDGEYSAITPQKPLRIKIYEQPTLKEFIEKCAKGWGLNSVIRLPKEALSVIIDAAPAVHRTIYDTSQYIQTYTQKAMQDEGYPGEVVTWLFEDTLYVVSTGAVSEAELSEKVIPLENVYSVTMMGALNSGVATITAPYDPSISPLSIVSVSLNFFQGAQVPAGGGVEANFLNYLGITRSTEFRVISMSIEFNTVRDVNRMELMAVSAFPGETIKAEDVKSRIKSLVSFASDIMNDTSTDVVFGQDPGSPESSPSAPMIPSGQTYQILPGDCMEGIILKLMGKQSYKPDIAETGIVKQPVEVLDDGTIVWQERASWPDKIRIEWCWPLVYACTQSQAKVDKSVPYCDLSKNPEFIYPGQYLAIPNISLPATPKQYVETFKTMCQWYQQRPEDFRDRDYQEKIRQLAYCYVAFGGQAWE